MDDFKMDYQKACFAALNIAVDIMARQEVYLALVVNNICQDEEEIKKLQEQMTKDFKAAKSIIMGNIYKDYGAIPNLDDLLS